MSRLVNNKMMRNSHTYAYDSIPLRVDTIGNEVTEGVLFNKTITMTTFDEYATMLNTLDKRFGINNIVGVYKGYTKETAEENALDHGAGRAACYAAAMGGRYFVDHDWRMVAFCRMGTGSPYNGYCIVGVLLSPCRIYLP